MYALLLLAVLVFSAFTPSTRQDGGTLLSRVTIVAAEEVGLTPERLDPDVRPERSDWATDAELAETAYASTGSIEKLEDAPWGRAPVSRWSSCWWLWVYTGQRLCS
jgi:hypothetical protein